MVNASEILLAYAGGRSPFVHAEMLVRELAADFFEGWRDCERLKRTRGVRAWNWMNLTK